MGFKLYVDNLPLTITNAALMEFFSSAGKVNSINIVINQGTGRPEGHAFVEMETEAEAKNAIHVLNGKELEGLRLTVTKAGPTPRHAGFSGATTTEERKNR